MLTRMTRMARMLTHMLTRMTRWLAGSHIIHTHRKSYPRWRTESRPKPSVSWFAVYNVSTRVSRFIEFECNFPFQSS